MTGIRDQELVAHLAAGPLPYTLRQSPRTRSLRVTIHPERGVVVTVPSSVGRAHAEQRAGAFLLERERWLQRHLGRHADQRALIEARGGARHGGCIPFRGVLHQVRVVPAVSGVRRSDVVHLEADRELVIHRVARDLRPEAVILEPWLRTQAREAIEQAIVEHAPALGVDAVAVTLRDPGSRWGSASRQGRLSFSWRLILAPPEALETVVVHELAHLRVFGHGSRFWALVATRRPDHATWRRWLHDHALELHRAMDTRDEA